MSTRLIYRLEKRYPNGVPKAIVDVVQDKLRDIVCYIRFELLRVSWQSNGGGRNTLHAHEWNDAA